MTNGKITVQATISADSVSVWEYYTNPEHITRWNFATDDWQCPVASNDMECKPETIAHPFCRSFPVLLPENLHVSLIFSTLRFKVLLNER